MPIRPAVPADAIGLAQAHVASWQEAYRGILPDEFLAGLDIDRRMEWFGSTINQGSVILVADGGPRRPVVGFCSVGPARMGEGWGEIYAIYVHPEAWGRGHGRDLLEAAETALIDLDYRDAVLWVLERNQRARDFYRRQGWLLGKRTAIEEIGGVSVTEVSYQKALVTGG